MGKSASDYTHKKEGQEDLAEISKYNEFKDMVETLIEKI